MNLPAPLSRNVGYVSGLRTERGLKWNMYSEVMSMLNAFSDNLTVVSFFVFLVIKMMNNYDAQLASLLYGAVGEWNE